MAGQRVAASGRFDQDLRPYHTGLDMHGSHLENAHADFILAEPRALAPDHRAITDFDHGGEQQVSPCPTAGLKCLRWHIVRLLWNDSAEMQSQTYPPSFTTSTAAPSNFPCRRSDMAWLASARGYGWTSVTTGTC